MQISRWIDVRGVIAAVQKKKKKHYIDFSWNNINSNQFTLVLQDCARKAFVTARCPRLEVYQKKKGKRKKKILHLFMLARQIDWARSSLLEMCHINARSPKYSQHSAQCRSETRTERCLFFVSVFTEIVHRALTFFLVCRASLFCRRCTHGSARRHKKNTNGWIQSERRGNKKKANQIHTEKGTARALWFVPLPNALNIIRLSADRGAAAAAAAAARKG